MSKQTPLQVLKQWVNNNYPNFNKADIETKIDELRPEERQGIIDCGKAFANFNGIDDTDIEDYFTQTYNQK